jgi:hypothetical protein
MVDGLECNACLIAESRDRWALLGKEGRLDWRKDKSHMFVNNIGRPRGNFSSE